MPHENSKTVRRNFPKLGMRYVVLDDVGKNKGVTLGPRTGFNTRGEADAFAQRRSDTFKSMKKRGLKQPTTR